MENRESDIWFVFRIFEFELNFDDFICETCTGVLISLYAHQNENKQELSKLWWAEEWIDLAREGTVGGFLWMW